MSLHSDKEDVIDRVIWLVLKFFLLAIELSVIVFGFMFGHLDSRRSIQRVLAVTFTISLAYSLTQGALEFASKNERFHNITVDTGREFNLYGHGGIVFWFVSSLVLSVIYITICLLPLTPIRRRFAIPTRKSFYIYCLLLAVLNVAQAIGCALLNFMDRSEGFCVIDVTTYVYFTGFAPLLYLTFLRSFFATSVRPSIHCDYRPQIDDVPEEGEPSSFYGPPRDTSINTVDETFDDTSVATAGFQWSGTGWHDMLVGIPELKPAGHSSSPRFLAGQTSMVMSRNGVERSRFPI
jgi:hypothetical protein